MKTTKKLFGILAATSVLAVLFNAQAALDSGLVAYYPFNGNANDMTGDGNDGTVNGATLAVDRFGNTNSAYAFNGSGTDRITIASTQILLQPSFSCSFWVKSTGGTGNPRFISMNGWEVGLGWPGAVRGINFNNNTTSGLYDCPSVGNFDQGVWHQVVVIRSATTMQDYIDGQLNKTITVSGGVIYDTNNFGSAWLPTLGASSAIGSTSDSFGGSIDDVRIYNRALSSTEVAHLFAVESTPIALPYVELKFDLKLSSQNTSNVVDGVATIKSPEKIKLTTKDLLNVLAADEYAAGNYSSDSFPKHAALALAGSSFVVVDGTNILVNVSDIMSFSKGQPSIVSGKQNIVTGLAAKKAESLQIAGIMFNDTFIEGGSGLKFYINGVLSTTTTDTTPVDGAYTETQAIQLDSAAGDGWSNDVPFTCTGTVSGKGKSPLNL